MVAKQTLVKAGLMAVNFALTATRKIEGPRLESLDFPTADYGTPSRLGWGVIRSNSCPVIFAEPLREKKVTSKTKGGKYQDYKYFGTWAVELLGIPIDQVLKVKFNKRVVFDATKKGPISPFISKGGVKLRQPGQSGRGMRIYLGDEDQMPDPRMEQWCEARTGLDSCPAYRGKPYLMIEDLPLEDYGNTPPVIDAIVARSGDTAYLYDNVTTTANLDGAHFTPDFGRLYVTSASKMRIWDTATRTKLFELDISLGFGDKVGISPSGNIYFAGPFNSDKIYVSGPDGGVSELPISSFYAINDGVRYVGGLLCVYPYSGIQAKTMWWDGAFSVLGEDGLMPNLYFEDIDGNPWAIGQQGTQIGLKAMPTGSIQAVTTTAPAGGALGMDNGLGQFVVYRGSRLHLIDKDTMTEIASVATVTELDGYRVFDNILPGASSIWLSGSSSATEYSTADLSVIRTITFSNWTVGTISRHIYDPINHAILGDPGGSVFRWYYLDRASGADVSLATILQEISGWVGVPSLDVSLLTGQTVHGWGSGPGPARDIIGPLLDMHAVQVRPHDFSVQFLPRGAAAALTIDSADMGASEAGAYQLTKGQDNGLPLMITLTYADIDADLEANTVIAKRHAVAVDSARQQSIDMSPYHSTPDEAQQLLDRYFEGIWNRRDKVSCRLSPRELRLEPADTVALALDGIAWGASMTRMTIGIDGITAEFERDDPALITLNGSSGPAMEGHDDEVMYLPGPINGFAFDIPLINDADDDPRPQLYYGAGRYVSTTAYAGAGFYVLNDEAEYEQWQTVGSQDEITWGYASTVLDPVASPWVWDRISSLNVRTNYPLVSATEAAINADPTLNMALVGDELINFVTATAEVDGSYTLTTLKRGRRGTNWACNSHGSREVFVLVEDLKRTVQGLSDIGLTDTFKVQAFGRDLEQAFPFTLTYSGATLKPYSPAGFTAWKDATGDWHFSWTRRTRLGGAWVGGATIPLGEDSEAYELVILDSLGDPVRVISTTSGSATYSTTDQTADFGAPLGSLHGAEVYQLSADVGRGFAASI